MNDFIEGQNLILRPITDTDTDNILKWRNSNDVRNNFIYQPLITREEHLSWLIEKVATGKVLQFIMIEKNSKKEIGSVYLRDVEYCKKEAEYGIFIGEPDAKGKGYGTEAISLIVRYAFDIIKLNRLTLRVLSKNKYAIQSYKKAGFKECLNSPDNIIIQGKSESVVYMELLNKEVLSLKKISYIIPCYRSSKTLDSVVNEIDTTMVRNDNYVYEIILVNDGSPDNTFEVISELCHTNNNIIGINMSKNFGQHAALMAGFRYATGDIVVCLDDDGQTPANEVFKLIDELEAGADVVYAAYSHKKHSFTRNWGSKLNSLMAELLLNKPKNLYISSYFATKRFIIDEVVKYEHSYPYVIGLLLRTTNNIKSVEVNHRERAIGTSGYTMRKLISLWVNGFTAFSVKPLRIATYMGILSALIGFAYAIWAVINKLTNPYAPMGWTSTIIILLVIGGMILFVLGLIGEYIGRIYISMNHAPQYVIRQIIKNQE